MKFEEKKGLLGKIEMDILIGICLGILGNALYNWLTVDVKLNRLGVVVILVLVLLWLIYKKEEKESTHSKIDINLEHHIENGDIMGIKDTFIDNINKKNWSDKDISSPKNNILQFRLENFWVFKVTFEKMSISVEYYENCSEAQDYLLTKFVDVIKTYKKNNNNLVAEDKLKQVLTNPIIVPGPVKYLDE